MSVHEPEMSVIIVNWNKAALLRECLESLDDEGVRRQAEVIVVDNGSTDSSREVVEGEFPWVTLIKSSHNLGFTGGNHLGLRHARGRIAFLLNNDARVAPGCIKAVLQAFENTSSGVVGCVVKDAREPERTLEAGLAVDRFGFMIPFDADLHDAAPFYVSGCAFAFRRCLADRLGIFDDRFYMFMEDVDMCWRYRLAGYRVDVARDAVVFHHSGSSITGGTTRDETYVTSLRRFYYRERNTLAMLLKNYSLTSLAKILPLYLMMSACEVLLALFMLRPRLAWTYVRALAWNVAELRRTWKLRKRVQSLRTVPDRNLPFDPRFGKLTALRLVGMPRFVK
jgi:GT2 family glycosyltransferase